MSTDDCAKRKAGNSFPWSKLYVVLFVLCTNLLSLFLFSGSFQRLSLQSYPLHEPQHSSTLVTNPTLPDYDDLISTLNKTRQELLRVQTELKSSRDFSQELTAQISELTRFLKSAFHEEPRASNADDPWLLWGGATNRAALPAELQGFIAPKPLPRGYNPNFGSNAIYPSVGHACALFKDDVAKYMDYAPGGLCPDDEVLAQKLMLRGCEPLPRRRCKPRASPNYTEPFPFPESAWRTPPDTTVVWTAYTCKSYACLIERIKKSKVFDDCKDCFDLAGREKSRWQRRGSLDYSIDEVLGLKKGTVRIGLDLGGGTGTFAVRMRERNVTIVTTSMNFNGPFNNFIAARGVVPLYITVTQRLPFFENTLDIVHSMHVLSNWIPTELLEFIFYDIYRILRPGGVFWLDHFFCIEEELEKYVPMIERLGFKKMRWSVGSKLDKGPQAKEMYISALLEKPLSSGES